jgi:hypothetical protein
MKSLFQLLKLGFQCAVSATLFHIWFLLGSLLVALTHLIPVWIVLHLLDGVALSIEVNQLPSPLVYLFLRNRKTFVILPSIGVKSQLWEAKLHGFLSWNF